MKVALFIPCFIDQLFPTTAINMVKVLEKTGCEIVYNPNQTCCGQPAFNAGFREQAQPVCEKFLTDMLAVQADYIVAPSGSCVGFVRNTYSKMFDNSILEKKYHDVAAKMYEFSEFMVKVLQVENVGANLQTTATYHDACGALRDCHIHDAPRRLLANVTGLTLVEALDSDVCCGFGGSFAVKMEPIASAMAQTKIDNLSATGSDVVISTDSSCLMHLEGYAKKAEKKLYFMHIADVLASGW